MADTPKGETSTPIDDEAGSLAPSGGRDHVVDTIAAGAAGDSLAEPPVDPGKPWSPRTEGRSDAGVVGGDPGAADKAALKADARPAPRRSGGIRAVLVFAVLLILVLGGAYATYPFWRSEAENLARDFGITLPGMQTAEAPSSQPEPQPATPPTDAESPAPAASSEPPSQTAPQPPAPPTGAPQTTAPPDPALAEAVDRLGERLDTLEQRLADREQQPAPAPAEEVERLGARLDEVESRLTAIADEMAIVRDGLAGTAGGEGLGPAASQLADRLQDLTGRLEKLEQEPTQAGAGSEQIQALQNRIEKLEQASVGPAVEPGELDALQARLDKLEQQQAAPTVAPERIDALQARIDAVAGSLDAEGRTRTENLVEIDTRLANIQSRLDQVAKTAERDQTVQEKAGVFLLAANQLAATTATSAGFEPELEALRKTAPEDAAVSGALDRLSQHAGGVPSLAVLRERFSATAAAVADASVVGAGDGVLDKALTRVASLVTLRRIASSDGDGLDAKLVRAETALATGDLAAAIEAVKSLEGDPAKAAAPWLADAEARAAVDRAVREVQSNALAGMAGG